MMSIDTISTSCSSFSLSTFSPSFVYGIGLKYESLGKSSKWQRSSKLMIIQQKTKRRSGLLIWPFRKWSTTKHPAIIRDQSLSAAAGGRVAKSSMIMVNLIPQGRRFCPTMNSKLLQAKEAATMTNLKQTCRWIRWNRTPALLFNKSSPALSIIWLYKKARSQRKSRR